MTRLLFAATAAFAVGLFLAVDLLGQTSAPTSSDAAKRAFGAAARFQNSRQFDLAAEDWERFLKQHTNDPLAEKARYYAGVCRMQQGEFAPAAQHFGQLLRQHPATDLAEDSLLNLGWCQYSQAPAKPQAFADAVGTWQQLLERFPRGKNASQGLFYLGEAEYARDNKDRAAEYYRRLVNDYPKSASYPNALYALGVAYEESERFPAAKETYNRFLREFASHELTAEVRLRRAETELQTGNPAGAAKEFAALARDRTFAAADHALWRQAYCAAQQGQYGPAGELYAQLLERFPNSEYASEAVLAAARSFYRGQQVQQAKPWLQRSIDGGGAGAVEAAHWLCRIHLQEDRPDKVIALADQVLANSPQDAPFQVHLKLDRADAINSERPDRAAETYYNVAAAHPNHELAAQALYNAAYARLEQGQFSEAVRVAGIFARRFPQNELLPDARQVAAEAAMQSKDYARAESEYRELITDFGAHPSQARWQVRLALTLHLQERSQEALTTLRGVARRLQDPHQLAEAHFVAGLSHFRLEKFRQARESFASTIETASNWPQLDEAWLYLSRSQHLLGETDAGIRSIRKLVTSFPQSSLLDQAYYRLGEYQFAAERFGAARTAYRQVIDSWPRSPFAAHARYGLGWTEIKLEEYDAAVKTLTRLLELDPPRTLIADTHLARGMAFRQAGDFVRARRDMNSYVAANPEGSSADALFELGLADAGEGDFKNALESFEQVRGRFPQYSRAAELTYEIAWAHKELGQSAESVQAFRQLISNWPQHALVAEAYFHLGEAEYQAARYPAALDALQRCLRLADDPQLEEQALHKVAWTHYRLDKFEEAADQFTRQLSQFPEGSLATEARFMQAECLYKRGEYQRAWEAFQASLAAPPEASAMRELLFLHGGQAAAQLKRWPDSVRLLSRVIEQHPDSTYLAEAVFERARGYQALGQDREAMADFERAAQSSDGEIGARALFMIGEKLFERREFEAAINRFRRVMYGFEDTESEQGDLSPWQAMCAYEAGRCAEVQILEAKTDAERAKLKQAAISYYEYLVKRHPQHKLAGQGKRRLIELGKAGR